MRFYRGTDEPIEAFSEGVCLTEDERIASQYAVDERRGGRLYEIDVNLEGLVVVDVAGYDRDENETPADNPAFRAARVAEGADVLRYPDESDRGETHETHRLVSSRAIAAVLRVYEVER